MYLPDPLEPGVISYELTSVYPSLIEIDT